MTTPAAHILTPENAEKAAKAQASHDKYTNAIENWATLSGDTTITGQFLNVMNQLAGLSGNLNKILGTIEHTIKIFGL